MLYPSSDFPPKWCEKAVIGLCCTTILLACLVLLGWLTHSVFLVRVTASYESMKIITAVNFILITSCILLLRHERAPPFSQIIAKCFLSFVFVISTFVTYIHINNVEFEFIKMPFLTSINFMFLSVIVLFIDNDSFNKTKLIWLMIGIILLNALFSLLGYVFEVDTNYPIAALTRMSIYTSLEFFLLCIAIILSRPTRGIVPLLLEDTPNALILRRVPLVLFFVTIIVAFLTNAGQYHDYYDDGFSDLLTAMISIIVLIALLVITSNQLQLSSSRIFTQYEIARLIESGESFESISPELLKILCTRLDWEIGEILLKDEKEEKLNCISMWNNKTFDSHFLTELSYMRFHMGYGVPGKAWQNKKSIWKTDNARSFKIITNTENDPILRSIVAIPILYKNSVIGILNLMTTKSKKQDNAMLKLLESIGIQLGEYISHQYVEEKITKMTIYDSLTGLMTHTILEDMINTKINTHSSDYFPVIIIDLDKFKLINESLGYELGDIAIQSIVEKLQKFSDKTLISRLGGNKFTIIPNDLDNINHVTNYVYKILSDIKEPIVIRNKSIVLTASIGVSLYPNDGENAKKLLKNAELAVLKSKQEGGDNFQFYTEELSNNISNQLELLSELRNAIVRNELLLYLQPKINLKTGKLQSVESLIRWQHPIKGLLSPNDFMHLAEENKLVIPITEWIITEVCKIISKYKITIPIAINLSGEHFKENFNLIGYLNQILKSFHVNPNSIELEITESVFMSDTKQSIATLIDLKKIGFKIAIDDFGTGFSSLNYLRNIAADYIKIDKSFVDNVPDNVDSVIIIKALIELSHALNKSVIAEGVETVQQVQFLVDQNCDQIQGYYFSKPLTIEELMHLIENNKTWEIPTKSSHH